MDSPKWDACILEPSSLLRWMECHPSTTQAIAAVAAVLASALFPFVLWIWDRRTKNKERREASGAFLAALIAPMSAVRNDIHRARHMLRSIEEAGPGWYGTVNALRHSKLNIPSSLSDVPGQLHNFDNGVVAPTRTALTAANAYNVSVESFLLAAENDIHRFDSSRENILGTLNRLLDVTEKELRRAIGR